jgi:hypothetical protein
VRDRPWEENKPQYNNPNHWWAHRDGVSQEGWALTSDIVCRPSWDKPCEIFFDRPIKLLPHGRRGIYCHSGLPDDLGIQYQSYPSKDAIVAQDQFITLLPGLGHTGSDPFDEQHGWYRSWRGLAGTVSYKAKWKGWNPWEHRLFTRELKDAVKTMLLCQNSLCVSVDRCNAPSSSSASASASASASCSSSSSSSEAKAMDVADDCDNEDMKGSSRRSPRIAKRRAAAWASASASASAVDSEYDDDDDEEGEGDFDEDGEGNGWDSDGSVPVGRCVTSSGLEYDTSNLHLNTLPKHVVYHIMEFMVSHLAIQALVSVSYRYL